MGISLSPVSMELEEQGKTVWGSNRKQGVIEERMPRMLRRTQNPRSALMATAAAV